MSDSDSSGSEEEIDETLLLETIDLDNLKGRWKHSFGDHLNVVGDDVRFDQGTTFTLIVAGDTVRLDGWAASVSKSTANRIQWEKEGEKAMSWRFEGELEKDDVNAEVDEVNSENIVTGKRRRAGVDYAALNKKLDEEEGKEQDDDGSDDEESRRRKKKARMDELASSFSSSSSSWKSSKEPKKKSSSSTTNLSPAELIRVRDQLGMDGALKGADEVLGLVKKLERHSMDLAGLKSSKIGKAANRYRKHTNSVISSRMSALVTKWKGLLSK